MNLADVLKRIQEAVDQVALVVRFLALFAILAGVIILSSSVAGTRYRRIREVAILKTLGGTKRRISAIFSIEFSILGAVSGLGRSRAGERIHPNSLGKIHRGVPPLRLGFLGHCHDRHCLTR